MSSPPAKSAGLVRHRQSIRGVGQFQNSASDPIVLKSRRQAAAHTGPLCTESSYKGIDSQGLNNVASTGSNPLQALRCGKPWGMRAEITFRPRELVYRSRTGDSRFSERLNLSASAGVLKSPVRISRFVAPRGYSSRFVSSSGRSVAPSRETPAKSPREREYDS